MTSCGGTSHVTTRSETLTILSIGQKIRTRPGPFSFLSTRPRRNTTARSYSRRIFMQLNSQTRKTKTTIAIGSAASGYMVHLSGDDGVDVGVAVANRTDRKTRLW